MATRQVPSVGRVVHYVAHGSKDGTHPSGVCRKADIVEVYERPGGGVSLELAGLHVVTPNGQFWNPNCRYDAHKGVGTWHWPESVPPVEVDA